VADSEVLLGVADVLLGVADSEVLLGVADRCC